MFGKNDKPIGQPLPVPIHPKQINSQRRQAHILGWKQLMHALGVSVSGSAALYAEIETHYSDPSRFYHDLAHVHDVLDTVATLQDLAQNYVAIVLAAWFHDVIYETDVSAENELKSALYAIEKLQAFGLPNALIGQVQTLILYTRHSDVPELIDAKILIDADLLPLAAEPKRFAQNSAEIRAEYIAVPDQTFYRGRTKVLKRFLAQDRIYLTDRMYDLYEAKARRNLQAGIDELIALDV